MTSIQDQINHMFERNDTLTNEVLLALLFLGRNPALAEEFEEGFRTVFLVKTLYETCPNATIGKVATSLEQTRQELVEALAALTEIESEIATMDSDRTVAGYAGPRSVTERTRRAVTGSTRRH
jgi:hypothetical protein